MLPPSAQGPKYRSRVPKFGLIRVSVLGIIVMLDPEGVEGVAESASGKRLGSEIRDLELRARVDAT